jgi:multicomponent Na+:H+ antiporter subunit G
MIRDILSAGLLGIGAFLMLTSALGVLRFPGPVARLHAATKGATSGLIAVSLGAGIALGPAAFALLVVVVLFQAATAPIAGHLLGRAAVRSVSPDHRRLVRDDYGRPEPPRRQPVAGGGGIPWRSWVALTVLWPVFWGDLSAANLLGGAIVALVVLVIVRPGQRAMRVSSRGVTRLVWVIAIAMIRGTINVAAEVLTRDDSTIRQAIVAVELPPMRPEAMALAAAAITLTPGSLAVDVDEEARRLTVHVLHYDEATTEAEVRAIAATAARALPGR